MDKSMQMETMKRYAEHMTERQMNLVLQFMAGMHCATEDERIGRRTAHGGYAERRNA